MHPKDSLKNMVSSDIDKEIDIDHFRVALFGSARIKKDDDFYKQVFELAKRIGQKDIDIVTGGGPGLMEAANSGHKAANNGNAHSLGLTIRLPWEAQVNIHLDMIEHFEKFSDRLDHFMVLSNVVIITPGGVGTCLEFFYTWQLTQVKHICHIPIILIGDMWKNLMNWVCIGPVKRGLISNEDMSNVYVVKNNDEAMEIIEKAYEMFLTEGKKYCFNYKKYKISHET